MACLLFLAPLWLLPLTCFHCKIFTVQKSPPSESAARHALCGIWKFFDFYAKKCRAR